MKKILFYSPRVELFKELDYFLNFFDNLNIESTFTNNLDFSKSSDCKKIAIVQYWQTYEKYHFNDYENIPDLSWADLVIFITTEFILRDSYEEIDKLSDLVNNKNIVSIIGGIQKDDLTWITNERIFFPFLNFFFRTTLANTSVEYSSNNRPFLFDCLLGSKKLERVMLAKILIENNLEKKSLISIYDSKHKKPENSMIKDYRSEKMDELENPWTLAFKQKNKDDLVKRHSGFFTEKLYPNSNLPIQQSCIISPKIYQNSWYTIASETDLSTYFFTEKIAKPLFGKRIFVICSSTGTLKFLRGLGFKTFDGIIDESYDNETDFELKMKKLEALILWLSEQNPIELYEKAKPILEHNYQIITKDLGKEKLSRFIKSFLYDL
jgi:hypothetical protein